MYVSFSFNVGSILSVIGWVVLGIIVVKVLWRTFCRAIGLGND